MPNALKIKSDPNRIQCGSEPRRFKYEAKRPKPTEFDVGWHRGFSVAVEIERAKATTTSVHDANLLRMNCRKATLAKSDSHRKEYTGVSLRMRKLGYFCTAFRRSPSGRITAGSRVIGLKHKRPLRPPAADL
ncbi:hypothetical protein EVAR_82829_1 [Eumeta japonica]|uniref:Uncharacterized protein n=1 Tax=Eumeta variegata TaxID=151549 RepID=A0A4C1V2J4_EUMVA|nr:hypothetical protein EVAR_82829_1 [Eumeta japonica]